MLIGERLYADDNDDRVFATFYGSEWIRSTIWRGDDASHTPDETFHDGNNGFLEPYCGDINSELYRCPATSYDANSRFFQIDGGMSYEGFMLRNNSFPEKSADVYVADGNYRRFTNANRRPFFSFQSLDIN